MHEPIPLGTRALNKEESMPPDDPLLCRLSRIERARGRLKYCIGTTTAAEMRSGTVKSQHKSGGLTMKYTDEKQHLMVPAMEWLEEERKRSGLSPLPRSFYQNIPSPTVNMQPPLKIPSPTPIETTFNETETELYRPKESR